MLYTITPIISLPRKQFSLLRKCLPPRIYILLLSQSSYDNEFINYEIEVGVQRGQIVYRNTIHKRFSELYKNDQRLRYTYKYSNHLREFPPKGFFAKKKELLDERFNQLSCYLEDLPLILGISKDTNFLKFFEIDPNHFKEL